MPAADRAWWSRLYTEANLPRLPWAAHEPFPPFVQAVAAGALPAPGPVLDIGCGLGANALWLARHGFRATGIDIAPGAIAAAESRRTPRDGKAKFLVDDVLASDLPPRSFRGAVDVGCFQTLPPGKRSEYAEGLATLMRPQGKLVLFWVAREETGTWGPPHRMSVKEVVDTFESRFVVRHTEFRPRTVRLTSAVRRSGRPLLVLAGYTAHLELRKAPQPPAR